MNNEPYAFKFHWLNDQGAATTMFRKRGMLADDALTLEDTTFPIAAIVQSIVRDNRMLLAVMTGDPENPTVPLLIQPSSKRVTDELKKRLDVERSDIWAQHHRENLEKQGLGATYRDSVCPVCQAKLILSGMPESPQLYCHFCDSLTTTDRTQEPIANEQAFKICEECGMYSKPQKFTIFYFYFLLVVYGWWSSATWRCPACMRGEAWKMLFGNLLFVVGVPVAIAQLIRSYGGDKVIGKFKGLDTGNLRARNGNVNGALEQYEAILERIPYSAGVKYNLGTALLAKGDKQKASQVFELALDDCVNYVPAYQVLMALYEELGETQKLAQLKHMWDIGDGGEDEPELAQG